MEVICLILSVQVCCQISVMAVRVSPIFIRQFSNTKPILAGSSAKATAHLMYKNQALLFRELLGFLLRMTIIIGTGTAF